MKISVITPSFERESVLASSVMSSIEFMENIPLENRGDIVVVDDCSSVSVQKVLEEAKLGVHIGKLITLITLKNNIGVTGAKQAGANRAQGDWLIFMDSDDTFISGIAESLLAELSGAKLNIPIVFFRCRDVRTRTLLGEIKSTSEEVGLKEFLIKGTPGECLPAIRRRAILEIPYNESLRGFEGLTHAKIIRQYGQCLISKLEARWYDSSEDGDRLSSTSGLMKRGCNLARGHALTINAFYKELPYSSIFLVSLKIIKNGFSCLKYKLCGWFREIL